MRIMIMVLMFVASPAMADLYGGFGLGQYQYDDKQVEFWSVHGGYKFKHLAVQGSYADYSGGYGWAVNDNLGEDVDPRVKHRSSMQRFSLSVRPTYNVNDNLKVFLSGTYHYLLADLDHAAWNKAINPFTGEPDVVATWSESVKDHEFEVGIGATYFLTDYVYVEGEVSTGVDTLYDNALHATIRFGHRL